MSNPFKDKYDFDTRKAESEKIKEKYPNRFPIIVHKHKKSTLPDIEKSKFLVPAELSLGQFMYIVRRRIKLDEKDSLFLFLNNTVMGASSDSISNIYEEHKDEDGFLYITYCNENVFG